MGLEAVHGGGRLKDIDACGAMRYAAPRRAKRMRYVRQELHDEQWEERR
jgi:hypothetical protein